MSEVGLSINRDKVGHSVVELIPEITNSIRLIARHTEVVDIAGEVRLARNAD